MPPSSTAAASAGSIRLARRALETYFRGVLLVPERELFVARLNGDIVGSAILVRPPRNNEAQAFAASLMHSYIAPYARGYGLARMLTAAGGGACPRARLPHPEPRRARDPDGGDRDVRDRTATSAGASIPNTPWCGASRLPGCSTTSGCVHAKSATRPMTGLTLYPAIDLKDGQCVRLRRGEMDQATVYADDPGAQAKSLAGGRIFLAARGGPERCLRRQAGERRRRAVDSVQRHDPGAAWRRHPGPSGRSPPGSTPASVV